MQYFPGEGVGTKVYSDVSEANWHRGWMVLFAVSVASMLLGVGTLAHVRSFALRYYSHTTTFFCVKTMC